MVEQLLLPGAKAAPPRRPTALTSFQDSTVGLGASKHTSASMTMFLGGAWRMQSARRGGGGASPRRYARTACLLGSCNSIQGTELQRGQGGLRRGRQPAGRAQTLPERRRY